MGKDLERALRKLVRPSARPDLRKACELAAELVALAEEHGSTAHLAEARTSWAWARMYSGDFELADQDFDQAWMLLESMAEPAVGPTPHRAGQMRQARTISGSKGLDKTIAYSRDGTCGSWVIRIAHWSE